MDVGSAPSPALPETATASAPRLTLAAEILELSDRHLGRVHMGQQEVLGGAEGERLDDADGEETGAQRAQRVGQRVVEFAAICACVVQGRHLVL